MANIKIWKNHHMQYNGQILIWGWFQGDIPYHLATINCWNLLFFINLRLSHLPILLSDNGIQPIKGILMILMPSFLYAHMKRQRQKVSMQFSEWSFLFFGDFLTSHFGDIPTLPKTSEIFRHITNMIENHQFFNFGDFVFSEIFRP